MGANGREGADRPSARTRGSRGGRPDLRSAIAGFDVVPAFGPAAERALVAAADDSLGHELVVAIESDAGLTLAVLIRAHAVSHKRSIASISDAVAALTASEIVDSVEALPRASFPWRNPAEALIHNARIHALAVSRAADRIAREIKLQNVDELLVAALLHDVGKLALAAAGPGYEDSKDPRSTTPEERLREERHELGIDHASVGGLLLSRWGLPERLARAVAAHHTSEGAREPADARPAG